MAEISVCLASYNGAEYIRRQLDSIFNQSMLADEVIVSDDGSTDGTADIVKSFPQVIFILNPSKGVISNFENALRHASGKYIFLADQDDEWKHDKIEKIRPMLDVYDLINHNADIIDADSKLITNKSFFELRGSHSGLLKNLYKSTYLGCCMAFNRKILNKSLPFPKDIEMHDRWLGVMGEIYGKVYFYPERLIGYRRHENNASGGFNKSRYGKKKQIIIRLNIVKNIIKRLIYGL